MAARKPPKRLFKNKEVVHSYQHDRENKTTLKHMVREHGDLLQNIESMMHAYAKEYPDVDDCTLDEALETLRRDEASIRGAEVDVKSICLLLKEVRSRRGDVTDAIWQGALRTVQDSVRRHSRLTPGEKSYIEFISDYV